MYEEGKVKKSEEMRLARNDFDPTNFDSGKASAIGLPEYLEDIEKRAILKALEKSNNNKTAAAKLLGVSFRTLRYRLAKLGLAKDDELDLDENEKED
jgi:two-component system, NtrC family, response regulator PilR